MKALGARAAVAIARPESRAVVLGRAPEAGTPSVELLAVAISALDRGHCITRTPAEPEHSTQPARVGIRVKLSGSNGGEPLDGALAFDLVAAVAVSDTQLLRSVRDRFSPRLEQPCPNADDSAAAPLRQVPNSTLATSADSLPAADTARQRDAPAEEGELPLVEAQGMVLGALANVLERKVPAEALRALADAVARAFACDRVAVGGIPATRSVVAAISGVSGFDGKSVPMLELAAALKEITVEGVVLRYPNADSQRPVPPAHRALMDARKCAAMLSIPLVDGNKVVGSLLLERDKPFSSAEATRLQQLVALVSPIVALKQLEALGPGQRLMRSASRHADGLFGLRNPGKKLGLIFALILVLWSTQHQQTFAVASTASIEPRLQRAVVAGSTGYLEQVEKRAGDRVKAGDVLARLDVEALQMERIKLKGEVEKIAREQRATLAQRERTRVRVLSAKRVQAEKQIEFLDAQIRRAVLRSPIDGVIVAGDLSEMVGGPVERGQLLFTVASLEDYLLVLMVNEADVGNISRGDTGRLRLRSLPNEIFAFEVSDITPVSVAQEGANQFRIEAMLPDSPSIIRPGMGGVAKIDVGSRALSWIWTHEFLNWAQLQLWRLGVLQ